MKKIVPSLAMAAALALPAVAHARPVTLTTQMNSYGGSNAFLAYYLTDKNGKYVMSLWMSGFYAKYYHYLPGWMRASRGNIADIKGLTGASTGSGKTLSVTLDLTNAMLNAGYQLHIDAAVRNQRESPNDVVIPLKRSGGSKAGRRFIKKFTLTVK